MVNRGLNCWVIYMINQGSQTGPWQQDEEQDVEFKGSEYLKPDGIFPSE